VNPIERFFAALLQLAMGLVKALLGGLMRAPLTAAEQAAQPIDIRAASTHEVADMWRRLDTTPTAGRHFVALRGDVPLGIATRTEDGEVQLVMARHFEDPNVREALHEAAVASDDG
jgi:hypothetical protein